MQLLMFVTLEPHKEYDLWICVLALSFRAKTIKKGFVWSFSCGPETSIARSKNYAEQIHLSLDKAVLNLYLSQRKLLIFFGPNESLSNCR